MLTAFLDANAMVPVALADTILRAAEAGLFAPMRSSRVFAEAKEAIRRIHPDLAPSRIESRFRAMDLSFPDACVSGWEPLVGRIDLPDPDDRHVVAAAWLGNADAIVTADTGDFPTDALEPFGLHAVRPDDFLLDLFDLAPDLVHAIIATQAADASQPPLDVEERYVLPNLNRHSRRMLKEEDVVELMKKVLRDGTPEDRKPRSSGGPPQGPATLTPPAGSSSCRTTRWSRSPRRAVPALHRGTSVW
jgi:predicted nucleic acid-binding protein